MRRIFVGDIQGCRDELEDVLAAVRFDPSSDELHPVGDLVNRGPDSLGTLRLLRRLDAGGVLGNHDIHLLRLADGIGTPRPGDTLDAVLAAPDRDELITWLRKRPLCRAWDDVVAVHAGLHPAWDDPIAVLAPLSPTDADDERVAFATRVRYCDAKGRRPARDYPAPGAPFAPWYEHWVARHGTARTVTWGHWARNGLVRIPGGRGLDTGCVWGGQLTAWIADEDRLVHVPARRKYSTKD
ncbi:MAG TPA: metallophosphoesterase [Candidatus Binatia bacterium]|jgi:bis(5'-nucleosyl)-tetraphosphatase (symmetrical)|nr:metallophosphoesterase [Candidatus Binatia bacterium]